MAYMSFALLNMEDVIYCLMPRAWLGNSDLSKLLDKQRYCHWVH